MKVKSGWIACVIFLLSAQNIVWGKTAYSRYESSGFFVALNEKPTAEDNEIISRLQSMNSCVTPHYTDIVKSYINGYIYRQKGKAQDIVGKSILYFPLFDEVLSANELPADLKYLAVLESALNPNAVSRSGAVGLWQLMSATGRDLGLRQNQWMDERRDPRRATEAAVVYLKRLYNLYNDWNLALAAYNSGPSIVNRAIKLGKSTNYWKIQRFLPKETCYFVPAFIAASYIAQFYHMHEIAPKLPDMDLQITRSLKVDQSLSFNEIASLTGVPLDIISILNPSYVRKTIPADPNGLNLTVPRRVAKAVEQYLIMPAEMKENFRKSYTVLQTSADTCSLNPNYISTNYVFRPQDDLSTIAGLFNCTPYHIRVWNALGNGDPAENTSLVLYLSTADTRFKAYDVSNISDLASTQQQARSKKISTSKKNSTQLPVNSMKKEREYLTYTLSRGETLSDVASLYPHTSTREIIQFNQISENNRLVPGMVLKIPAGK